jgi:predicted nucleotidyltransferase component of viral defense system
MLHLKTVEPDTFSILEKLMTLPTLNDFSLVGGTALSLLFGHRISEDLDLFSDSIIEKSEIILELQNKFGSDFHYEDKGAKFGVFCFIHAAKVDIVKYPHPTIRPILNVDGIRMYSVEDIMAMKVQAILGRGKKKDFYDVAELLQHYTVTDFVAFHKEKFSTQNLLISVPQTLTYFEDANEDEDPISLKGLSWHNVQDIISEKVRTFLQ